MLILIQVESVIQMRAQVGGTELWAEYRSCPTVALLLFGLLDYPTKLIYDISNKPLTFSVQTFRLVFQSISCFFT
jgi:hypothetical protein